MSVRKPSESFSKKKSSISSLKQSKDNDDELNQFLKLCEVVYISLLGSLNEDVTTSEELMQCM